MRAREQDIRRGQGGQQHLHQPGPPGAGRLDLSRHPGSARSARRRRARRGAGRRARGGAGRRRRAAPPRGSVPQRVRHPRARRADGPPALAGGGRPRRPGPRRRGAGRPRPRRRPARVRHRGHHVGRDRDLRRRSCSAGARPIVRHPRRRGAAFDERHRPSASSRPSSSAAAPGRGGGKIPHPPKDALERIPEAARRVTGPALPEMNEPDVVRHYVNLSQLNYAVDTGLLPARLVHDEVQPQAQRVGGPAARLRGPPSDGAGRGRAGHAAAAVGAGAGAGRDLRHARGHAPAGRRRPGRADRDPDDPCLPPRSRRHPA